MGSEVVLFDQVEAILGEEGLARRDGAGDFNADQLSYAVHAAKGFQRRRKCDGAPAVNMLEAGPGVGRTIGYLVPAMLYAASTGEQVVVSTFSRHLRMQLLALDAPRVAAWVAEVTGRQLSVVRRLSRQNYLSRAACHQMLVQLDECRGALDAQQFLEDLCDWLATAGDAPVLDDFLAEQGMGDGELPGGLAHHQLCISARSPAEELRAYEAQVERSRAADVLIADHALVMGGACRWAAVLDGDRPAGVLVCDEADRLGDSAEVVLSADVSPHRLLALTETVAALLDLPALPGTVRRLAAVVAAATAERPIETASAVVVAAANDVLGCALPAALACADTLRTGLGEEPSEMRRVLADFVDAISDLQALCLAGEQGSVMLVNWLPLHRQPRLRIGRAEPGRVFSRLLAGRDLDGAAGSELAPPRRRLQACLFTSPMLATPGLALPRAFDAFIASVGVVRVGAKGDALVHNVTADLFKRFQPRRFGRLSFILPDPRVVPPSLKMEFDKRMAHSANTEWLDYCASMIREASKGGGRTLALTLSFEDARRLSGQLEDLAGLIVHCEGEPLEGCLQQLMDRADGVLITPMGWDGVELPEGINDLVITRIPYSPPGEYRALLMRADLMAQGMSQDKVSQMIMQQSLITARRKLALGVLRGIRRPDDHCRVWVADPRFPQPDCFADSLDEVLMSPRPARTNPALLDCIPVRFGDAFRRAKLFLSCGTLHAPETY